MDGVTPRLSESSLHHEALSVMGRLSRRQLPDVRHGLVAAALLAGGNLTFEDYSEAAEAMSKGRIEHGAAAAVLFPEADFKPALVLNEAAMDTGDEFTVRQRFWQPLATAVSPAEVEVIIRPVFADVDDARPVAVLTEVHPVIKRDHVMTGQAKLSGIPGGIPFYEAMALGLPPDEAAALLGIREAARDAFVEAAGPLVEELRRLRRQAAPSGLGTPPEYQRRRPA